MITLEALSQKIQEKLTDTEFNFYITTDTGKFKRSDRTGNVVIEYVNGLLTSGPSEVTNLVAGSDNSLIYATQTAYLSFIIALSNSEEDTYILDNGMNVNEETEIPEGANVVQYIMGNKTKIAHLRAVLNSVFQGVSVEDMTDSNGKSFSVTTFYQFIESGVREQNPIIGNSFTFSVNVFYSFVQNGINTRDMVFYLDGFPIPYQSCTPERTAIMDGNVYANSPDGMAENFTSQTVLNISFELPAVANNAITNRILTYIMFSYPNRAHLLRFTLNGLTKDYIVSISGAKASGETIKNVGLSLTFVPVRKNYALLSFSNNIKIYSATSLAPRITTAANAVTYKFGLGARFINPGINLSLSSNIGDKIVSTAALESYQGLEEL